MSDIFSIIYSTRLWLDNKKTSGFHLTLFRYLISSSLTELTFFLVRFKFNSLEFSGYIIISNQDNDNIFSSFSTVTPDISLTY